MFSGHLCVLGRGFFLWGATLALPLSNVRRTASARGQQPCGVGWKRLSPRYKGALRPLIVFMFSIFVFMGGGGGGGGGKKIVK